MLKNSFYILCIFLILTNIANGQTFHRIKADFSIKEKKTDGSLQLIMGKVYFDKNYKKVVYLIDFPDKQTILMYDTAYYRLTGNTLIESKKVPNTIEFTVFNLCLNGNLSNYGLNNSVYKATHVEKDQDMVITTWTPDKKLSKQMGKVMLSVKDKKLYGVVIFSPKNEILQKQFYNTYQNVNGLEFPSEVVEITYHEGTEYYKVTTYRNILVDEKGNETIYNYRIPVQ